MNRYLMLRIAIHLGALLPLAWLFYAIPNGLLGADPVKELIHFLGLGAIRLCLLSLAVSPIAKISNVSRLNLYRRALGLWSFTWATLHIAAWIVFDLALDWALLASEIIKRSYIWLGLTGWIILLAMAITSIPKLIKLLGKRWKQLHGFVYPAILVICVHYWWALKSGWMEPALYLSVALLLLGLRLKSLARWGKSFTQ